MQFTAIYRALYSPVEPLLRYAKDPRIVLLFVYAFILLRTAWVCDDAYITFRTIDNFINGHGLTWNVTERVQVYTHPLWMFLLAGLYFFSHEIYFTSLFFSIAVSLIAFYILLFKCPSNTFSAIAGALVLLFSQAFVDYSTSGLENPLTHLTMALFFLVFIKQEIRPGTFFVLAFLAGVGCFNRMDTILIFFPALLYAALKLKNFKKALTLLALGFIPFLAWEAFALFYYGFPFPNTAYAKLNIGLGAKELLKHGLEYFYHSVKTDPITLTAITAGGVIVILKRNAALSALYLGGLLYMLYVLKIGGDFMSGRFFTAPLVVTIIIISQLQLKKCYGTYILFVSIFLAGLLSPYPPLLSTSEYGKKQRETEQYTRDVCDERAFYYQNFGLMNQFRDSRRNAAPTVMLGRDLRAQAEKKTPLLVVRGHIGFSGYFSGPKVHIVDYCALGDPLLARLPPIKIAQWRIGHFRRYIPPGYLETLETGTMQIEDKDVADYYHVLQKIIQDDVCNFSRIKEIIKINLGMYDSLIDREYWANPL